MDSIHRSAWRIILGFALFAASGCHDPLVEKPLEPGRYLLIEKSPDDTDDTLVNDTLVKDTDQGSTVETGTQEARLIDQ